jgi:hypothetical protein
MKAHHAYGGQAGAAAMANPTGPTRPTGVAAALNGATPEAAPGAAPVGRKPRAGLIGLASLLALLTLAAPAHAGRHCEERPLDALSVQRAMTLAERTARALDATGARVVVLARAGQDLSKYGLRYSHLGFAYRDEVPVSAPAPDVATMAMTTTTTAATTAAPPTRAVWRVVHKLNHCGTARGELYRQGLGEFFLDRLHVYEAGVAVLSPAAQAALEPILRDNRRSAAWHEPRYNMLAYPWAQRYQQSNQWAIETLAGALEPQAATRRQAQAWLQLRGYQPAVLQLNAFTRLGARVGTAHIAFDDHPNAQRYADRIETVTVDSVFAWLEGSTLAAAPLHLR